MFVCFTCVFICFTTSVLFHNALKEDQFQPCWIKAVLTTKLQDEDSSPLLGVTPPGWSHPCGQWAAGAKETSATGPSYCYPETWTRRKRRAGSDEARYHHAPPPAWCLLWVLLVIPTTKRETETGRLLLTG